MYSYIPIVHHWEARVDLGCFSYPFFLIFFDTSSASLFLSPSDWIIRLYQSQLIHPEYSYQGVLEQSHRRGNEDAAEKFSFHFSLSLSYTDGMSLDIASASRQKRKRSIHFITRERPRMFAVTARLCNHEEPLIGWWVPSREGSKKYRTERKASVVVSNKSNDLSVKEEQICLICPLRALNSRRETLFDDSRSHGSLSFFLFCSLIKEALFSWIFFEIFMSGHSKWCETSKNVI